MLFPRGQYGTNLFPQVENLRGDRDGGLDALSGGHRTRSYDTCGYMPRVVRQSAALLSQAVGRYGIVSSISIYRDFAEQGIGEIYGPYWPCRGTEGGDVRPTTGITRAREQEPLGKLSESFTTP